MQKLKTNQMVLLQGLFMKMQEQLKIVMQTLFYQQIQHTWLVLYILTLQLVKLVNVMQHAQCIMNQV